MKRLLILFMTLVISFTISTGFTSASATEFKLLPGDGADQDYFGMSVAVSGDTAIIGAPDDDDNGSASGSAYVFVRSGDTWSQQAKLTPEDGVEGGNFGYSVAISGDTAVIGASGDDENGSNSGSVYVFVRTGTDWSQQAKILPADGVDGDHFGNSVAIASDIIVIGAFGYADSTGSVYVFERSGDTWSQQTRITAGDADLGDNFGYSLVIIADKIIVGAPYDDDNGSDSGAIYSFVRQTDSSWSQQAKIIPGDGAIGDNFGYSVASYEETLAVGAPGDDDGGEHSGSAYVFVNGSGVWAQQAKLTLDAGIAYDYFGWSVGASEDVVIVGAPFRDDNGSASGSAYQYTRDEGIWSQSTSLIPGDGAAADFLGMSLSVSEDIVIIGVPYDDDNGNASGSAYAFNLSVNISPVADTGGPYTGDEGLEILLDASSSYDVDDFIVNYEWDLDNDGEYDDAAGITAAVVFDDDGTYTVGLRVTDSYGAYGTDSTSINVNDLGPVADFSWSPETPDEGTLITFSDMSLSSPDVIMSYDWDFTGTGSSVEQNPVFIFDEDGIYTVTLTVTDDDGSTDNISQDIVVGNVAPDVDAGPDRVINLGDEIEIAAVFTDPGIYDTHSANISWGDGSSGPMTLTEPDSGPGNVTSSHMYTWPGIYEVVITVIDDDGGEGSDTLLIEVIAVPEVMIDTFDDKLEDAELPAETENSLSKSLDTAGKVLQDNNPKNDVAAVNNLEAMINKLEAQRGKKIPADIADELIAIIQEIIDALNGGM